MRTEKVQKLLAALGQFSAEERRLLLKQIGDLFPLPSVSKRKPVWFQSIVYMNPSIYEERADYVLTLTDYGMNTIQMVKLIRQETFLGIRESKEQVKSGQPLELGRFASRYDDQIERIMQKVRDLGGDAIVKPECISECVEYDPIPVSEISEEDELLLVHAAKEVYPLLSPMTSSSGEHPKITCKIPVYSLYINSYGSADPEEVHRYLEEHPLVKPLWSKQTRTVYWQVYSKSTKAIILEDLTNFSDTLCFSFYGDAYYELTFH